MARRARSAEEYQHSEDRQSAAAWGTGGCRRPSRAMRRRCGRDGSDAGSRLRIMCRPDVETERSQLVAAGRGPLGVDDLLHLLQRRAAVEQVSRPGMAGAALSLPSTAMTSLASRIGPMPSPIGWLPSAMITATARPKRSPTNSNSLSWECGKVWMHGQAGRRESGLHA